MGSAGSKIVLLVIAIVLIAFYVDPALANRFETIGGGVVGSRKIKLEYLRVIAFAAGAVFLVAAAATVITHKRNAQMLNYTMWKPSTFIFTLLGTGALIGGLFM